MTSELIQMQAPQGVPLSTLFEEVSDPLLPPKRTSEMLAHFSDEVFDKRPESHLSRMLKILLGDSGTGQLRKRYTYAHLSTFLLTARYLDLDKFYAETFGLKRFVRERLDLDVYNDAATDEEWEAIDAADASYRSRVQALGTALGWAGTPTGMALAAFAVLGEECRIYESYEFLDNAEAYSSSVAATTNSYGDLEQYTYGELNNRTYASLEGEGLFHPRVVGSRGEFIVRPLRDVTAEERYHLIRVLSRLKPAEALLTIDSRPARIATPVNAARAVASSTYWHVQRQVQTGADVAEYYAVPSVGEPAEQPRVAFSQYQGEAWNYNGDTVTITSYVEDEEGVKVQEPNFERIVDDYTQTPQDFRPENALTSPEKVLLGRYASDGIMSAPAVVRL